MIMMDDTGEVVDDYELTVAVEWMVEYICYIQVENLEVSSYYPVTLSNFNGFPDLSA